MIYFLLLIGCVSFYLSLMVVINHKEQKNYNKMKPAKRHLKLVKKENNPSDEGGI